VCQAKTKVISKKRTKYPKLGGKQLAYAIQFWDARFSYVFRTEKNIKRGAVVRIR
jgi:hypothetical protein